MSLFQSVPIREINYCQYGFSSSFIPFPFSLVITDILPHLPLIRHASLHLFIKDRVNTGVLQLVVHEDPHHLLAEAEMTTPPLVSKDYCVHSKSAHTTMEPLNKGHIGASHFVLCREVVCSSEVHNVLTIWGNKHLGTFKHVLCREII